MSLLLTPFPLSRSDDSIWHATLRAIEIGLTAWDRWVNLPADDNPILDGTLHFAEKFRHVPEELFRILDSPLLLNFESGTLRSWTDLCVDAAIDAFDCSDLLTSRSVAAESACYGLAMAAFAARLRLGDASGQLRTHIGFALHDTLFGWSVLSDYQVGQRLAGCADYELMDYSLWRAVNTSAELRDIAEDDEGCDPHRPLRRDAETYRGLCYAAVLLAARAVSVVPSLDRALGHIYHYIPTRYRSAIVAGVADVRASKCDDLFWNPWRRAVAGFAEPPSAKPMAGGFDSGHNDAVTT